MGEREKSSQGQLHLQGHQMGSNNLEKGVFFGEDAVRTVNNNVQDIKSESMTERR